MDSSTQFVESLCREVLNAGLDFSEAQAQMCYEHISLMLDWNRRQNLTRITGLREILIMHVLDSILPARWLPRTGLVLDVGTGPGFPGIPLKILNPACRMVLVESNRKKTSFLKVLLSRLNLPGLHVLQSRWEQLMKPNSSPARPFVPGEIDLVVMRAVRLEQTHVKHLGLEVLRPGGLLAWWGGPSVKHDERMEELRNCAPEMAFVADYQYSLPSLQNPRHLLVWKRTA